MCIGTSIGIVFYDVLDLKPIICVQNVRIFLKKKNNLKILIALV